MIAGPIVILSGGLINMKGVSNGHFLTAVFFSLLDSPHAVISILHVYQGKLQP